VNTAASAMEIGTFFIKVSPRPTMNAKISSVMLAIRLGRRATVDIEQGH
jgi:hypothetical protein